MAEVAAEICAGVAGRNDWKQEYFLELSAQRADTAPWDWMPELISLRRILGVFPRPQSGFRPDCTSDAAIFS